MAWVKLTDERRKLMNKKKLCHKILLGSTKKKGNKRIGLRNEWRRRRTRERRDRNAAEI